MGFCDKLMSTMHLWKTIVMKVMKMLWNRKIYREGEMGLNQSQFNWLKIEISLSSYLRENCLLA